MAAFNFEANWLLLLNINGRWHNTVTTVYIQVTPWLVITCNSCYDAGGWCNINTSIRDCIHVNDNIGICLHKIIVLLIKCGLVQWPQRKWKYRKKIKFSLIVYIDWQCNFYPFDPDVKYVMARGWNSHGFDYLYRPRSEQFVHLCVCLSVQALLFEPFCGCSQSAFNLIKNWEVLLCRVL